MSAPMVAPTTPHGFDTPQPVGAAKTAAESKSRGLTPQRVWARSEVHRQSAYSCARCGASLRSPAAVYRHLDARHARGRR